MSHERILLVEDEHDIVELLEFSLGRAGFEVRSVYDAEAALKHLQGPLPDLVLIDWMLPGMNGDQLARKLRLDELTKHIPLIMLTARSEEKDKLNGFDAGADDYITKPFSTKELIARIKAVLRRSGSPDDGVITIGGVQIDSRAHRVEINGESIHLRPTEYRLLELFLKHPNRAYSRGQLLDIVWGRRAYVDERTVDVHVLRLRKALSAYKRADLIQTVWGMGYRLDPSSIEP